MNLTCINLLVDFALSPDKSEVDLYFKPQRASSKPSASRRPQCYKNAMQKTQKKYELVMMDTHPHDPFLDFLEGMGLLWLRITIYNCTS